MVRAILLKVISWTIPAAFFLLPISASAENPCARIISLAPSITETVYELGLWDSLVGVTRYDTYPPAVKEKTVIGGFLDPNLETIISLKPSLVLALTEQRDFVHSLEKLGIKTAIVEHRSIDGILKSFSEIGGLCAVPGRAKELTDEKENYLNAVKARTGTFPQKKVVVIVSRTYDSADLKDLYLSGSDGFYDELLSYAGGRNVFKKMTGSMTGTSVEGLYALDPDYIIELLPPRGSLNIPSERLQMPWMKLSVLRAVRDGHVFLLDDDWATIPGPRMTILLDRFAEILHPEVVR